MTNPIPATNTSAENMVRDVIERWRGGDRPDAANFLSANPDVRDRKTLAMDLIYEEYCLRHDSGEPLVPSTFCQKFPTYKQSLQRLLDVHQFMDGEPAAEEKWKWPQPGDTVLGFKLVEQLGAGAIARVYLAQQPELGQRHVVVKISRHGESEAKLLGKLEHPSIVPIHSVHQDPSSGLTCICMPFLGTATLTDLLDLAFSKGKPPQSSEMLLTVARQYRPEGVRDGDEPATAAILRRGTYCEGVIQLGVQLAEALAAAHEAGVMHRDIKPSNVLLSRSGRPMLLDFNLSSDLEMPLERVGGTVAYMAPERIQTLIDDEVRTEIKLDPPSDVYSLGALLYELLCGELPSRPNISAGKQPRLEDWLKCRLTPPDSLTKRSPDIDARMEQVVLKALHPDPAERFPSAAEFATALQDCLAWKARSSRWLGRNRRQVLAVAACALAAAVIGGAIWASGEPYEQRMFAAGQQVYAQGDSQAAIESFSRVLERQPDNVAALFARGQAYRQAQDYLLAQRDFQAAYDKSKNPELLVYVGFCDMKEGQLLAAQASYELAVEQGHAPPQLFHNIAYCLSRSGRPVEAVIRLEELLKKQPSLFLSHRLCARLQLESAYSNQRPVDTATKEHIQKALQGNPGDSLLVLDAARVYAYSSEVATSKEEELQALDYLRQAIAAGVSKQPVVSDRLLGTRLLNQLSSDELKRLDQAPATSSAPPLYYEPSSGLSLPMPSGRIALR